MSLEMPLSTSDRLSGRGRVRALEETPSFITARPVPQISPLRSVHILITDPYEGISDEQIKEITIPCGFILGRSGSTVVDNLRKMDQARASECSTAEASCL